MEKKWFGEEVIVPDGKGGRKLVKVTDLTPQFVLLCTCFFI